MTFYRDNARWLLGGFLLTFFSAFGQTFFISIWGSEIRDTYGLTHGGFGGIYMVATLASAACFPFVGRLVDVVSVSKSVVIVIAMLSLATAIMGLAEHVGLLVVAIFMLRLFGQGMMGHTAMTAMGRWYSANRGKAVSFASIGHQFSEAIAPTLFVALSLVVGWRGAWGVATLGLLLIALPATFLLMRKERIPSTAEAGNKLDTQKLQKQWTRFEVLKDPLFWLVGAGVFAPAFIGTSIWFHQDYLIELNGWPEQTYYSSFMLMAATTVSGALLTGLAIDRWSAVHCLPFFMVPLGLACLTLSSSGAVWAIFVTMFLMGISYGISSSLFGALWPEVYGTRHLGAVRSVTMAFMVFMSAAGPGATGLLIDGGMPFPNQLLFIGLYCLSCAMLMWFVSRRMLARLGRDAIYLSTG